MQGMSHGDGVDEDKMMKHDLRGEGAGQTKS